MEYHDEGEEWPGEGNEDKEGDDTKLPTDEDCKTVDGPADLATDPPKDPPVPAVPAKDSAQSKSVDEDDDEMESDKVTP